MDLQRPICLVGNGTPRLRLGRFIDSYATIIRMNNYRIDGFADLVGTRTDLRAVTGWMDVENRNELVEISPFTYWAHESRNMFAYCTKNEREVFTARDDVHCLIPEVSNPSAGLALAQLFESMAVPVDLFGFDAFRSPHYWDAMQTIRTTHSSREAEAFMRMKQRFRQGVCKRA